MPRPAFKAPAAEKSSGTSIQEAARVLGLRRFPANELELADIAKEGLPSAALSRLSSSLGWTRAALIEQLGIAPRTAARRLRRRELLSTTESERVLRLARAPRAPSRCSRAERPRSNGSKKRVRRSVSASPSICLRPTSV